MSFRTVVIFTDRDGDEIVITPRDRSKGGNPIPDPVIGVRRGGKTTQSVVMTDEELDGVMKALGDAFGYTVYKATKRS